MCSNQMVHFINDKLKILRASGNYWNRSAISDPIEAYKYTIINEILFLTINRSGWNPFSINS